MTWHRSRLRACTLALWGIAFACYPLSAQQPAVVQDTALLRRQAQQAFGRSITQAQLLERLRQSGMTRSQIRERLQQAGYDGGLADHYFDVLERGGEPAEGVADETFVRALQQIGIAVPGIAAQIDDSIVDVAPSVPIGGLARLGGSQVFGRQFFAADPLSMGLQDSFGPVDRDYRLGPGDEILLVLTGDVELAYTLSVTREGYVVIPDVGQVSVNGLTLAQLENQLYNRLGSVYSGVRGGVEATTHFQVSMGRLRSNQVFVVGDVVAPGAKQVSGVGRVLNALYAAGGPTDGGSFRRIEVRRGSALVGTLDMYDYLLRGDASSDIRLEHGDRIVVPPAGPQVRIQGSVRRPAVYEMTPGEGLTDVLGFAGGLEADAILGRIQIDRILPPNERTPGQYRVVRDADLAALFRGGAPVPLYAGDVIHVLGVPDIVRNRVWVTGAVNNPGIFEWSPGSTLSQFIARADGLADPAYTARLQIYRLDPVSQKRSMIQAPAPGNGGVDPVLSDGDSIVVLSRETLVNAAAVSIQGFVKQPGEYGYADGMTLRDLVLSAGGFVPGANIAEAEISRLMNPFIRSDSTAQIFRVLLDSDTTDLGYLGIGEWPPGVGDVPLNRGDRVTIRRAPGFEPLAQVMVTGEVLYPGAYVLSHRQERVVDVLSRAGWLTSEADVGGIRITRRGSIVAANMQRALNDPSHRANIRLEPGDTIHVAAFDPTVTITGAVLFSSRVVYRPGLGMDYYLDQAGGVTDVADKERLTISYPNGERARASEFLWFDRMPQVLPGSTIYVPEKPERERQGFDFDRFLSRTLTVIGTLATVLIAVDRL